MGNTLSDDELFPAKQILRVNCLLMELQQRRIGGPRLPPELFEPLVHAFCNSGHWFIELCYNGNVRALQHWHDTFGVERGYMDWSMSPDGKIMWSMVLSTSKVVLSSLPETHMAMVAACTAGHVSTAQWLHQEFALTKADMDACDAPYLVQRHPHLRHWWMHAFGDDAD